MLIINAYSVQMNFEIPESEKKIAEQAVQNFEQFLAELKLILEYLDLIYTPFSKAQNLDTEEVVNNRDILRRYKKELKDKFDSLIKRAYTGISFMSTFSTDYTIEELMTSLVDQLRELERQGNFLLSIFSNLNDQQFQSNLISSIEIVKKECFQIKQFVNDRVLEHIDTNILAKNWESLVNEKFNKKIKNRTPLLVELYQERNQALKQ